MPAPTDRQPVPPGLHHGHRWPALLLALVAAVGVWATWRVFVGSRRGQLLDEAAFDGGAFGRSRLWVVAEPVLDVISIPFMAVVLVAAMLLAVLRSRVLLAVQVAVLVGGANLSTQLLKHVVLDRPDLDLGTRLNNTLPSGHTTAAASVSAALLLVVPRPWRPLAAVLGVLYTGATGVSTMVGGWHRPSDVVAGILVVVAWAGVAVALVRTRVLVTGPDAAGSTVAVVGVLLAGAAVSGVLAAVALQRSLAAVDDVGRLDARADLLTAYGGGALGVVAVTCAGTAALLRVLQAAETRRLR